MERKIWGELLSRQHVQSQAINSGDQRSKSHYYYQSVGPVSWEAPGWFSSGVY